VFTLRAIAHGGSPILRVSHDAEDHGWQFLDGGTPAMEDAMLVALREIVALDPTVFQVADLPPGWFGTRSKIGGPWTRGRDGSAS
jgi:hypothetical protein